MITEYGITLDAAKSQHTTSADGGIVSVTASGLTVADGASLQNSASTGKGGAVYVNEGATVGLTGGTINGNTASEGGAGLYLVEGSTLNLSGNPNFGGTGIADGTLIASTENGPTGNFVSMSGEDLKNGGAAYSEDDNGNLLVRQDIFIAGYQGEDGDKSVTSLVVSGSISSGAGSIWVWADQSPHYKTLQQFATIKAGGYY